MNSSSSKSASSCSRSNSASSSSRSTDHDLKISGSAESSTDSASELSGSAKTGQPPDPAEPTESSTDSAEHDSMDLSDMIDGTETNSAQVPAHGQGVAVPAAATVPCLHDVMKGVGVAAVALTIATAVLFFVWSIGGQSSQAGGAPSTRAPNAPDSGCPALHNTSEIRGVAGVSCIDDYTFATLVDCVGVSADNTFEFSQAFAQLNSVAQLALQNVSTPVNQVFSQLTCPPYNGTDPGSLSHIQQVVASLGEQLATLAQQASQPAAMAGLQRGLSGGMDLSASAAATLRDGLTALAMLLTLHAMGLL